MDELEIPPQIPAPEPEPEPAAPQTTISIEEWMASGEPGVAEAPPPTSLQDAELLAVLEAIIYVAEEPLTPAQLATALQQEPARIAELLAQLVAEFDRPEHGVSIREVAGGFKMATKPEHHEAVRAFVKSLKAPLKLSLPALETLAVIAYKQPVTTPEIMEIRGVQGGGVLKTLLDRKLVTEAGRKNVIGKPILYKTTKEFLIQFGLKDLSELPSLKEFEEIRRMAFADSDVPVEAPLEAPVELAAEPAPETLTAPPVVPTTEPSDGEPVASGEDAPVAAEPLPVAETAAPDAEPAEADAKMADTEASSPEETAPSAPPESQEE